MKGVRTYLYRARVYRIVDADTMVLDVDLGLETTRRLTVRLWGIDAVEKSEASSPEAVQFVRDWILKHADRDGWIDIRTIKDKREKYGRYLVSLMSSDPDGSDLNYALVSKGFAKYVSY